jgi:hypothetical protein
MNYDIDTPEGMANSVAWTESTFMRLKEGGVWFVPRSMTAVHVYPSKKEVRIRRGPTRDSSIERVIKKMGWTVKIYK